MERKARNDCGETGDMAESGRRKFRVVAKRPGEERGKEVKAEVSREAS